MPRRELTGANRLLHSAEVNRMPCNKMAEHQSGSETSCEDNICQRDIDKTAGFIAQGNKGNRQTEGKELPDGELSSATGGGCRYEMLRRRAQEIYPGCHEAARWSAQDCITLDGLPYIGRFSRRKPKWYVATGFGKWGMTTAMVSARILTALISGKECSEADIFSPQRHFTARAAKELATHGAYTVKGLAKHLLPSGNKKIIPNCPHMGCRLEWNPDEESYDCPCHGSRFDREGKLLDDPAQIDCKRRKGR